MTAPTQRLVANRSNLVAEEKPCGKVVMVYHWLSSLNLKKGYSDAGICMLLKLFLRSSRSTAVYSKSNRFFRTWQTPLYWPRAKK